MDIRLKNKKTKNNNDYRQLRTKLFIRTLGMIFSAILIILFAYSFVLRGYLSEWVVLIFRKVLGINYYAAVELYTRLIRNNMEIFLFIGIILVFFLIFYFYLRWFTKYFGEINHGIDTLIEEGAEEVSLPTELRVIEKKINTIKHTLEKRKLDAQLAEQRKNDLVVYLAHDLKTPLTSVIGYLTLLRDERQISEELREKYISISLDKAERLEDLINEFFEITRFNLSDIILQYSRVNLTRLLEQLAFEFKPMLLEKNLTCNLDADPDIMIRCDAGKMQRVFDNLIRNGVYYSFEGSDIDITVVQEDKDIIIQFVNHGDDIPKEKQERIFEQFFRLDTARGSNSGGSGLGLAIAKEIVELHQGTITVQSKDERIEFTVTIPNL